MNDQTFIHILKRAVKYHTSETRHSSRNKLTDPNSSNGKTITWDLSTHSREQESTTQVKHVIL